MKRVTSRTLRLAVVVGASLACNRPDSPVKVELVETGGATTVVLRPRPGVRINAGVAPALELPDGRVLRFDADELSADSAYYAAPPFLRLDGAAEPRGTIRLSVCGEDEPVCRPVRLEL